MVPGRETLTSEIRACLGGARADSGLRPPVSSRNVSLCGSLPRERLLGPRRLWLESHVFLHFHIQIAASSGCKDALEQSRSASTLVSLCFPCCSAAGSLRPTRGNLRRRVHCSRCGEDRALSFCAFSEGGTFPDLKSSAFCIPGAGIGAPFIF